MSSVARRVLVVQHADDCPPALFGDWLTEAGCTLHVCRSYAGEAVPDVTAYDGLLVLGGPMGANDDADVVWLGPLKEQIRRARDHAVSTLGICLGHQLVAVALGGVAGPNPRGQQLGLLDVGWTGPATADLLFAGLATPRRGVHWNHDLVTHLPDGAVTLAETADGELQAARFAPRMWGVQLHPEVDGGIVRAWADSDRPEHDDLGIEQEPFLRSIDLATGELEAAWRPLASSWASTISGNP